MDQTVEDRESGDTLSDIEGEFEGTTDKMGITLLIDDGYVTVDIPTYRLAWNCGYFTGMISHSPLGTTMRNKLNVPDVFIKDSDSEDADDEDENEGKDPDPTNDYDIPDYTFELPEGAPGFIFDPDENGRTGFDYNHDGKVDEYTDDKGNVYKDSDFDGVFETVYESEWGMG
ncbi:MAG: hypothetical protein PHV32_05700 [Eubacteriales bacterium]|nr:hypothetical protein [Eubacteriales bacterium]